VEARLSRIILVCLLLSVSTGCAAPHRAMTRNEWTKMAGREFIGKSQEEVLDAASRVMQLCDPTDVHISYSGGEMIAQRNYGVYLVLAATKGVYTFDLQTEPSENGTLTNLTITLSESSIIPTSMGTVTTTDKNGQLIEYQEIYDLFYKRMASLLYGDTWVTCSDAGHNALSRKLEGLCLVADDNSPSPDEIKRAKLASSVPITVPQSPEPPADELIDQDQNPRLSLVDQLDDLDLAKRQGKITKAEYKSARAKILAGEASLNQGKSKEPPEPGYLKEIRSKETIHQKVKAAADLCSQGKISKEERNRLQAAILRGEM